MSTRADPVALSACRRPRFNRTAQAPSGWRALPSRARLNVGALRAHSASRRRSSLGLRRPPMHAERATGSARLPRPHVDARATRALSRPGSAVPAATAARGVTVMAPLWPRSRPRGGNTGTHRRVPKRGPDARQCEAVAYRWSTGAARGGPREVRRRAQRLFLAQRIFAAAHPPAFRYCHHAAATTTASTP